MSRQGAQCRSLLVDGRVVLHRGWLSPGETEHALDRLRSELAWSRESLVLFGRRVQVPRAVAWYGDPGCRYRYSGLDHEPLSWTPTLAGLRERLAAARLKFNSVLANRYRDGAEYMGWHSDDEPELGPEPLLASLSFGATRRMRFRHRARRHEPVSVDLAAGDLLIMAGPTQANWQHCLARTARPSGERINLTFRRIVQA